MPKLLLVEDDNNLREIYQARLQAEGYDIITAKDGEEALVVAKDAKPDLVISDVMMPKISGFEMLDILRNTDGLQDVKVIMLTALGQTDDQARADKLGADRYLVKSQVTLEDIVKSAHELLQESGAEESTAEEAPAEPAPAAVEPTAPVAVAAEPEPAMPAPAAAVEPTPAPAPVPVDPAPAPAVAEAPVVEAQTTSEETAAVNDNIESFVAGATSEAPAPLPAPEVVAAPAVEPAPMPPTEPTPVQLVPAVVSPAPAPDAAPATSDTDKVMEEAVKSLNDATASTPETVTPSFPAPDPAPAEEKPANVGGMKVLEPSGNTEQKKDINDLLAIEEAKEAAQTQTPLPEQPLQAPAAPTPQQEEGPTDPSSISL